MANIPVEKKGGASWLWWLIGLLLVAGLIWIVVEAMDDDPEGLGSETAETEVSPLPAPVAEESDVTIGDILGTPGEYVGGDFPITEVTVAEVPTDRGFWIEDAGQRLFAVIIDQPQEEPKDINPGQTLQVEEGTLRDPAHLSDIEGVPLDQQTQDIARQQEIFLVVDEANITIVEGGTPQPGTDPAQSIQ